MKWKRLQRVLPLLVLLAAPPAARSGFEGFLKIEGTEGEATDPWHTNWVEVLAVTNEMVPKPFPMPPEPSVDASLTIVKELDKSSPQLYLACCNGRHFNEVILDCCAPQTARIGFYHINLSNVVVKSVEQTATILGSHGRPVERILLAYDRISWTYTRVAPSSSLPLEYLTSSWDLVLNRGGSLAQSAVFKVTAIQKQPGQVVLSWLPEGVKSYRIFSSSQIYGAFSLLAEVPATGDQVATYTAPLVGSALFFTVEEKQ